MPNTADRIQRQGLYQYRIGDLFYVVRWKEKRKGAQGRESGGGEEIKKRDGIGYGERDKYLLENSLVQGSY